VKIGTGSPGGKVFSVTVALPRGLSFNHAAFAARGNAARAARGRSRTTVSGLSVAGGKMRSAKLRHGRLTVTLQNPARSLRIRTGGKLISESRTLRRRVRNGKVKTLEITVTAVDANKHSTTQRVELKTS
jgi:hypothetical protein